MTATDKASRMTGKTVKDGVTRTSEAVAVLRRAIVRLELKPGTQLDERFLTEELGIGRTPGREALRQIATDGLVELRSNRGPIVTNLDLGYVKEFFDANAVAERMICHFVDFRAPKLVAELTALSNAHAEMVETGSLADTLEANRRFHNCLIEATRNRFIIGYASRLALHDERINHWVYGRGEGLERDPEDYLRQSVSEHADIVAAVATEDRAWLSNVSVAHVRRTQTVLLNLLAPAMNDDFGMSLG